MNGFLQWGHSNKEEEEKAILRGCFFPKEHAIRIILQLLVRAWKQVFWFPERKNLSCIFSVSLFLIFFLEGLNDSGSSSSIFFLRSLLYAFTLHWGGASYLLLPEFFCLGFPFALTLFAMPTCRCCYFPKENGLSPLLTQGLNIDPQCATTTRSNQRKGWVSWIFDSSC